MVALDLPSGGSGSRDQLAAAGEFVEIFDDDVGIEDDVAVVEDQNFEYSSLGWPGATAAGTNSILSIKPVSIAAMRTLRANGEAGEKVSFIFLRSFEKEMSVILRCEHFASLEG
jgi:hypothetical protein